MPPRKDFFIDHHPIDRPWAEWSAWHLEHAGYVVVTPAWDFRPGANVVQEIQRATVVAKHTLALLSPEYLKALNTQPAWAAAFAADLLVRCASVCVTRPVCCVLLCISISSAKRRRPPKRSYSLGWAAPSGPAQPPRWPPRGLGLPLPPFRAASPCMSN